MAVKTETSSSHSVLGFSLLTPSVLQYNMMFGRENCETQKWFLENHEQVNSVLESQ